MIEASKCISYLSIEHRDEFSEDQMNMLHGWIFGCDICQDVCPWNRFSKVHKEVDFLPNPRLREMTREDWAELDETTFNELFTGTAVERTGYTALRRNIEQTNRGTRNKE